MVAEGAGQKAERSIKKELRETIAIWSDVAGTKGLGVFHISNDYNPEGRDICNPKKRATAQPKPGFGFPYLYQPMTLGQKNI